MKEIRLTKQFNFKGKRRIGLDSCVIIDMMDSKELFSFKEIKIFSETGLFVTHRRCIKEVTEWLIEKRSFNKKTAFEEVDKFLKEHNISIVEVNISNKDLLEQMKRECAKKKIEFHTPDSWIIADFKKAGVNKVYSANNHFLDACRLFGIEAKKFPTVEKEIEQQLKGLFNRKFTKKKK